MRARGLGAKVTIAEVEPLRALEAMIDGCDVELLIEAARHSDIIVTATGNKNVVDERHFEIMKEGCIHANSGHFDAEINVARLREIAAEVTHPRCHLEAFRLPDGRQIRLLAEGRLVNLAAAEGHPAAAMDISFANQPLAAAPISGLTAAASNPAFIRCRRI